MLCPSVAGESVLYFARQPCGPNQIFDCSAASLVCDRRSWCVFVEVKPRAATVQDSTVHASSGVQHGPFPVHCMHIECVAGVMLLGQSFQVLVLGCRRHFRPLQRRRRFAKAAPRFQRKRQQIVNFSF